MSIQNLTPEVLREGLARGEMRVVDVREADEFARVRIDGAELAPLSRFDPLAISRSEDRKRLVLVCRTGRRSEDAARRLLQSGAGEVSHLSGGLAAWQKTGLPVVEDRRAPISILRQVQLAAGGMIVTGGLLGAFVSPWFHLLSVGAGVGLIVAGLTDTCAMASLLERMPWNRRANPS